MADERQFRLPDLGEGLTEGEIVAWHVKPGDTVTDGQVICEAETAKAVVELPVPFDGVVVGIHVEAGTTVPVGTPLITVEELSSEPRNLVGYGVRQPRAESAPRRERTAAHPAMFSVGAMRPRAKPPVRRLARDLGVDLASLHPTGPHGTIRREDVLRAEKPAAAGETAVPVTGVRKATAAAMVASAFTAPHVTEFTTVDVTRTMKLVRRLRRDLRWDGLRPGPLLFTAAALIHAVRENPEINARWDDTGPRIVRKHRINLGVAVAGPRGLLVPNVKDAGVLSLRALAERIGALVTTAREGRCTPADLSGGTVTLTNVGTFGVETATPILNPGEAAILALGAVRREPHVHKGAVVPRDVVRLALSFDHRLVDGDLGSRVLIVAAAVLEDPIRLLTWA
jgi:pyruvate dehydrogenase E2 component (dihydrolipoamide acetyltransferase)